MKHLFLILSIVTLFKVNAQENMNWVFALNEGLSFQNDSLSFFHTIGNVGTVAGRGNPNISDNNGNLLFYSNHNNIYGKNNQIIENGDQIKSVSHSFYEMRIGYYGYFIKQSSNQYEFLTFSVNSSDSADILCNKIEYNGNNKNYAVTSKNQPLYKVKRISCFEIIQHSNLTDYWIILREGNTKAENDSLSVLLYKKGQITLVGKNYYPLKNKAHSLDFGLLSLSKSPTGNRLVEIYDAMYKPQTSGKETLWHELRLYNFNPTTGSLSNLTIVDTFDNNYLGERSFYQCFSPNEKYLYVAINNSISFDSSKYPDKPQLYQYDLVLGQKVNVLPKNSYLPTTSIEMAINGKIYFLGYSFNSKQGMKLFCINKPNKTKEHIQISSSEIPDTFLNIYSQLPKYANNSYNLEYTQTNICNQIELKNISNPKFSKFIWFFSDNDSIITNDLSSVKWKYAKSGKYTVKIKGILPNGNYQLFYDDIEYINAPLALFSTTSDTGCQYISIRFINNSTSDTSTSSSFYHWDFGDDKDTTITGALSEVSHTYFASGQYSIRLVYSNGLCTDSFRLNTKLNILPSPEPGLLILNKKVCYPGSISIFKPFQKGILKESLYIINDDTTTNTDKDTILLNITKIGKLSIHQILIGTSGCKIIDSLSFTSEAGFVNTQTLIPVTVDHRAVNKLKIQWGETPNCKYFKVFKNNILKDSLGNTSPILTYVEDYQTPKNLSNDLNEFKILAYDACGTTLNSADFTEIILVGTTEMYRQELQWKYFVNKTSTSQSLLSANMLGSVATTIYEGTKNKYDNYLGFDIDSDIEYFVTIKDDEHRFLGYSNKLVLYPSPTCWIPTAFSPNNDGLNDTFSPQGLSIEHYTLSVYNTWGQLIYSDSTAWDGNSNGKTLSEGIYIYHIKVKYKSGKFDFKSGSVQLIKE